MAPAVAYGASGEHGDFPGTLSIGTDALVTLLVEVGRSADAFGQVVFVNGHGGNLSALHSATSTLSAEGRTVRTWSWAVPGGDAHAGRTETSMMLAIAPEVVHLDVAEVGAPSRWATYSERCGPAACARSAPTGCSATRPALPSREVARSWRRDRRPARVPHPRMTPERTRR